MSRHGKIFERVMRGTSDANILFTDIRLLLQSFTFDERIRGSHHIFSKVGVEEIINLQPKGTHAKPYQVKQVRNLILKYKLGE